jgi:hypothetical protein
MTERGNISATQVVKPASHSLTMWLSGIVTAIGVFMTQAPELLTKILSVLTSDQVQQVLALMPPKTRAAVASIVQIIGAALTILGLLQGYVRVAKTNMGVALPQLPFKGGGKKLVVVFVSVLLLAGCATTSMADYRFPALDEIATPGNAEEALGAGTLAYQFVVGSLNALHDFGIVSNERHEELVTKEGSPSYRVRDGLKRGLELVDQWRATGNRKAFDDYYAEITSPYNELKTALKKRGKR